MVAPESGLSHPTPGLERGLGVESLRIPTVFNADPKAAALSFRRLAALEVEAAGFGHGDPLTTDAATQLRAAAGPL